MIIILNEIKDYYYDGVIKKAKDSIEYSDWSDARSDLYLFCSDIRSELYSEDIEGAKGKLQKFAEKVQKNK